MRKHLLGFVVVVALGAGVGCGEPEGGDGTGAAAVTAATAPTPLTAAAPDSFSAAAGELGPDTNAPQSSVAAMAATTCGACMFNGLNGFGHFKGVRNCCLNLPYVDGQGNIRYICYPYQENCSASWSASSASRL